MPVPTAPQLLPQPVGVWHSAHEVGLQPEPRQQVPPQPSPEPQTTPAQEAEQATLIPPSERLTPPVDIRTVWEPVGVLMLTWQLTWLVDQ